MFRFTIAAAILAAVSNASWTQDAPAGDFPFVGHITTSQLNVRMMPKTDAASTVVAVLKEGDEVTVIEEKDGFYGIQAPKGAGTWVHSRNLEISGDTATVSNEAPVRSDSRVTAPVIATLKAGTKVKVMKDHLGWVKIDAGDAVHFWVGKKYVKPSGKAEARATGTAPARSAAKAANPDPEAQAKIREAEQLIAEIDEHTKKGEINEVDYNAVAERFEQAATMAKDGATRQYAESNAKLYRRMQLKMTPIISMTKHMDEQKKRFDELWNRLQAARDNVKSYVFRGYVDTTGAFLKNRPGTHKLVSDDKKIVCFLKVREDDPKMIDKINDCYEKFVGVNGTVIQNPVGWPGYNVVLVDEIQVIKPEEALFLLGEESSQK